MAVRQDLRCLLEELFDPGDFRVLLADRYPNASGEMPTGPVEQHEWFAKAIEVLERHGSIDDAFFAELKERWAAIS